MNDRFRRNPPGPADGLSRRAFIGSIAAIAAATKLSDTAAETAADRARVAKGSTQTQRVTLSVNGRQHQLTIEPRVTLLDALRDYLGMTGTKKGCDRGQCGACTVLVDGRRINACLTLAVMQQGVEITTVEGLAADETLSPMQAAFVDRDAFQCGFCTPGQLCAATALLTELRDNQPSAITDLRAGTPLAVTDDEIRERMSGNLCRCGAYPNIVAAIRATHERGS